MNSTKAGSTGSPIGASQYREEPVGQVLPLDLNAPAQDTFGLIPGGKTQREFDDGHRERRLNAERQMHEFGIDVGAFVKMGRADAEQKDAKRETAYVWALKAMRRKLRRRAEGHRRQQQRHFARRLGRGRPVRRTRDERRVVAGRGRSAARRGGTRAGPDGPLPDDASGDAAQPRRPHRVAAPAVSTSRRRRTVAR